MFSLPKALSCMAIAATVVVVTSCTTTTESNSGGPGIEYGATLDQYQAAFGDIEPVHLYAQTPGPQGSFVSDKMEIYYDAVTEWSGGKVTFDIFYANAIAGASEIDDALGDGRTDIDGFAVANQPAEYPAVNTLVNASFLGDMSPIAGILQSHAWLLESAYATEEVAQEFADNDMHLLMPSYNGGGMALLCTEEAQTLDQLRGRQISAAGRTQGAQISGLGAIPVSASYSELYESLQRGVVDCTATSVQNAVLGGYLGLTPEVVIDPAAGFALTFGSVALNENRWNSMPLLVQQLLFDRLDVFLETNIRTSWDAMVQGVHDIQDAGGTITEFAPDARERLQSVNDQQLELLKQSPALEDAATSMTEWAATASRWSTLVRDLGYDETMTYPEFADFYDTDAIDLGPYVDAVFDEVLLDHRPASPDTEA
nr:TRAP transporter substrate-binding protein DctP [Rhodococcus sp. 06-621-2]